MDCYAVADQMAADGMTVDEPYRDERIRSPLHWSIQARDDLALEWLLKRITELDQVDYNGDTPLYESVIFGNRPAFARLLEAGAQLRPAQIVFEKSPMLQVLLHPDGVGCRVLWPALKKGASRSIAGALLCIGFGRCREEPRVGRGLDGSGCTGRLSQW